ncbi:sirohydrochlorin chelatase [Saccharomonospora sp. NPDC006951]
MIVLAAHGTRDPDGGVAVELLAERVRASGTEVRVAYADVRQPGIAAVLGSLEGPSVVVPAFLAPGYHVREDIPAGIAEGRRHPVVLARPLGPDPELLTVLADRLRQAGHRDEDAVVLAAAGSRDPLALSVVDDVARNLGAILGKPIIPGFAAPALRGQLSVAEAVERARAGQRDVAVASWLLAPGLFHRRAAESGADVVADPLCTATGVHPAVTGIVLRRYAEAQAQLTREPV